ncbi:DUF2064 domain-containing protein [soil metagenome]
MSTPSTGTRMLVMAKAPVPGLAKTRLAATVGDTAAAAAAAAALLDTLNACSEAVGAESCVLALAGDPADAVAPEEIRAALTGWTVVPQRGDGFDELLAHAHHDAGDGPVLQVGMDTPQLTGTLLREVAAALASHDCVLGPADDGGWWVLGRHTADVATALLGVAMSTPTTHDDTRAALLARGVSVATAESLRDVDTSEDADHVAGLAPDTRFAHAWTALRGVRR